MINFNILGATTEELLPMFFDDTEKVIGQRLSVLAFDEDNCLVGMLGSGSYEKDDIEKYFGPPGEPVLELKDDYYDGKLL